jgi:hypothetical protein
MRAVHRTMGLALFGVLGMACGSNVGGDHGDGSGTSTGGSSVGGSSGGSSNPGGTSGASGGTSSGGTSSGGNASTAGANSGGTNNGGSSAGDGGSGGSGGDAPTVCEGNTVEGAEPAEQELGVWVDVTPPGVDVESTQAGAGTILADPVRKGDLYVNIQWNGTWRSTDYGCTWTKTNTGEHAAELDAGFAWYAAIDRNPCRDPNTDPTLYVTSGFGAGGLWKSTNAGVDWKNVWDNNIYKDDGVTSVFSDVGSDVHCVHMVDPSDPNHLIASLHGYWGSGNNNGVFETTDGGGKWIVHASQQFNFQPHSDLVFPIDKSTWIVAHGATYPNLDLFRTTNSGDSWDIVGTETQGIGRVTAWAGDALYSSADAAGFVSKSTDGGVSWEQLDGAGNKIGWVATTPTRLYAGNGYAGDPNTVRYASLDNDNVWTETTPSAPHSGIGAAVTFDGEHYVIVAAQGRGGVWRYVEP